MITVEPVPAPVLKPPAVTLATVVLEELQVAEFVRSWAVPSLKIPIAVN